MHVVVVVESPAKAKTIRGYLGAGYRVIATRGHVKDLPAKDGSVDTAHDFAMVYVTKRGAGPPLGAIANALHDATGVRMRHLPLSPERVLEALGEI